MKTRIFMVVALGGAGCDTTIHQSLLTVDAPPDLVCLEAARHSDFAWIEDNILNKSCSNFATCHTNRNPPAHLDLTKGHAFGNLVNVPEVTIPDFGMRVAPGDPDHSYILIKLGLIEGPVGDAGTTMPPNSPVLCAEKLDAMRRWIAAGALNGAGGAPDAPPAATDAGTHD